VILTNSFGKKTQKAPATQIALAGAQKKDYQNKKK